MIRDYLSAFLACTLFGFVAVAEDKSSSRSLPLPPEVADLTGKYQAAMTKVNEPVSQFTISYTERLRSLAETAKSAGDLDGVLAIQDEIKEVEEGEAGNKSEYAPLATLQQTYHDHSSRLNAELSPERIRIESAYIDALQSLIEKFTKEGQLDAGLVAQQALDVARDRLVIWESARGIGLPNPSVGFDWSRLTAVWDKKDTFPTTTAVGGSTELRTRDRDVPEEPAILVGFELWMNPFGESKETVRGAVPLFKNEAGRVFDGLPRSSNAERGSRRRVTAKDGYVVGGIKAKSERAIRSMSIIFYRLTEDGTDPSDSYESKIYGDWEGGTETEVFIGDKVPVGIDGHYGLGLDQLAIITADP